MKRNVLHIIYRTDIIGGVENFLSTLLNSKKNDDIIIQLSDYKNNIGITNRILNLKEDLHSYNPIILLYQIILRAFKYKKICEKEKINISISHGDSLNLSNIISKIIFRNKSKIYIFLHNSLSFYTNSGSFLYKYLFNYFYPKADKIITISEEMTIKLKNKGYNNIEILYNPLKFNDIEILKNEPLLENNKIFNNSKKSFITIARLEKVKNLKFLIDIFNEFNKKYKGYQFLIIGDGKERKNLKELINKKGNKNIKLLGKQNNVYKFLYKSDYFLFSSLNEGFGRVLIESLACSIPVLTHDFKYGAKEIIRNNQNFKRCKSIEIHENGILVPYMDKNSFLEAMIKITKINFDKNKIKNNIEKYNIKKLQKNWEFILNNE